ncbi:MAG: MFS transporter, partial [Actinobacteria bacterium]|nr:MFS transporter [Actinomycetota bacterium]
MATLGLTTIVSYGTTQYFFGVILVPIQHDQGWSRGSISGAYSTAFLVAGVLGLPVGRLVDRHGARLLMAAGSLLGALCLVLLSRVTELWQFYLLWGGGLGLAMALTLYPVSFTVVTNWFHRRRGTALAALTLLGGLSSPIYVPAAGLLVARVGWRQTMLILAATQIAIALPLHGLLLRRHPEDLGLYPDGTPAPAGDESGVAAGAGSSVGQALRSLSFWTLTLSFGLGMFAQSAVLAHQVAYMIGRGFDPVLSASLAGLVGAASLPGRLIFNLLSDRFGPQRLLVLSTLIQAAGAVLLVMASSPAWLWAYVVVYGAAFGAVSPLRASTMADQFGRRAYGAITAAGGLPVAVLGAAGPLVAGILFDRLGGYG